MVVTMSMCHISVVLVLDTLEVVVNEDSTGLALLVHPKCMDTTAYQLVLTDDYRTEHRPICRQHDNCIDQLECPI